MTTSVPDWYELALLSLAAWRIFQLIAHDEITEGIRRYVTRIPAGWDGHSEIHSKEYRETLALFLQCPYCIGFWIALGVWALWLIFPTEAVFVSVPLALSAGVIAGDRLLSSE